jgi:two-component system LytT family sensor kinase
MESAIFRLPKWSDTGLAILITRKCMVDTQIGILVPFLFTNGSQCGPASKITSMKSPRLRVILRSYAMAIAFWYGISLLMGGQYGLLNQQDFWSSFLKLMVMAAAQAFSFALWTPPIFYLVGRSLSLVKSRTQNFLLFGIGVVPFVLLQMGVRWALIPPNDETLHRASRSMQSWLAMVRTGFADATFIYIAIVVAAHAYEYLKRVRRQEAERYEYQQALAASELQALKMQLHPHFLFNTLNGIATLVDEDAKSAKAMIIKLSSLLRTALERGSSDLIPLEDELRFVREYLDLEKMRFGSRLKVTWLVASETLQLLVPQMILQPLVENAIRHGVTSTREGGWIEIAAGIDSQFLNVRVRNSVGGKTSNGTGVGLRNAEARLKYLYSRDASLQFAVAENGIATASLVLPALTSQPDSVQGQIQTVLEREGPLCVFSSSMTNP